MEFLIDRLTDESESVAVPEHLSLDQKISWIKDTLSRWDREGSTAEIWLKRVAHAPRMASPTPVQTPSAAPANETQASRTESVYLPTGKLNIPYLIKNAELLLVSGEYALARNVYQTLLQSGERSSVAHFGLGRCYEAENKWDDARRHYEESIAFQGSLEAYRALGSVLIRQKRDLAAADVFERALYLKDLPTRIRFELHKTAGNCWMRSGKRAEAETQFRKALEIDPLADEIRSNLGALFLQHEAWIDAKRNFEDALASNPRNAAALSGLGTVAYHQNDKRLAHDYFVKSLDINLQNATAIYFLVKTAYELRSYATAARIVEQYIQVAPVNLNLLYSLAGLQFHLGRLKEARSTIDRILSVSPEHAAAQELLGLISKYESAAH